MQKVRKAEVRYNTLQALQLIYGLATLTLAVATLRYAAKSELVQQAFEQLPF